MYWIEPLADGAPVPPGLERIPEPGTIVVSPALHAALEPDVADQLGLTPATRDGRPVLIDQTGLASSNEFVAYARPPVDRSLGSSFRSVDIVDFGAEAPMTPVGLGYEPDSPVSVLLGGVALLAVPSLYLLWVAVGSGALIREARLDTLFEIGAGRSIRRRLVFLEAVVQACAGVALGVVVWLGVLVRLPGIPVAGLHYFRGDLEVPPSWCAGVVAAALIVVGLLAVAQSSSGRWRRTTRRMSGRPGFPRRMATVLRVGALGSVLALIARAQTSRYPKSAQYWQLAVVMAVVSQPLILPLYVSLFGRWAARRRPPTTWLAGRRMTHSPARLARPAFALGGLVLVAVVGISVAAVRSAAGTSDPSSDPAIVSVSWEDATAADVGALRAALPSVAVLSLVQLPDGDSKLTVPSCTDLLAVSAETSCDGEIPASITERVRASGRNIGMMATVTVDQTAEQDVDTPIDAVVVLGGAEETGEELYERVLPVANRILGVTNLFGGQFLQFSESSKRAAAGIAFAATIALVTALMLLGDRSILIARENEALELLGLPPASQQRIAFLEIALPGLTSTAAGGAVGAVFALTGQDLDTKPETLFLWIPILSTIAVVALLTIAVAFWVSRIRPPSRPGPR